MRNIYCEHGWKKLEICNDTSETFYQDKEYSILTVSTDAGTANTVKGI